MFGFFALLAVGLLIAAYFQKGLNRALLIILAIAIIELKSIAWGIKLLSLTVIIGAIVFLLRKKK